MKEYVKPSVEYVKFNTEVVTDFAEGEGGSTSNVFDQDEFT